MRESRIPWFDNVPVFGWIMLRGRCRQCHNPISARYPLVEAITAAMFGLLAIVEIEQLTTLYPIHLLLLCTLLCAGLIEHDGNRPPWRLFFSRPDRGRCSDVVLSGRAANVGGVAEDDAVAIRDN